MDLKKEIIEASIPSSTTKNVYILVDGIHNNIEGVSFSKETLTPKRDELIDLGADPNDIKIEKYRII